MGLIVLGYPDQAVTRICEALIRVQELAHPYSLVYALIHAVTIHQLRLDIQAVHEHAETTVAICEEQEFAFWLAVGRFHEGWVLVAQGRGEEGVARMRPGIAPSERLMAPYFRALLAEAYATIGQTAEGWGALAEALEEWTRAKAAFMPRSCIASKASCCSARP